MRHTDPKKARDEGERSASKPTSAAITSVERVAHHPFPVVGIGASAGGLEAIRALLSAIPGDTGMSFVIVQHLDPHHESRLSELLAKVTPMPVLEATHGLKLDRDHVYVIPPNANLALADGVLMLTPRPESRGPHLPVDWLFRSLAQVQQARAIGVVLSGTGSDGTLGLCEIKAVGGITFAQVPSSAAHAGMPHSAVESGCIDFVIEPVAIGKRLVEIAAHPYLMRPEIAEHADPASDVAYQKIMSVVRASMGVDFSQYRDTTIRRRIMRRMALHAQESLVDYAHHLESDREEVIALYHDLLINVTSFFRDAEMFEALKSKVFPAVVDNRSPNAPVRVWIPGCSTGQEAYSMAMTIVEFFDDRPVRPAIHIFATDVSDRRSLEKARGGVYPESIEAEVSPERLRRFFRREDRGFRIDKELREMCVFARHNVTADPPFAHLDLISCRNVLIYLSTPLQRRVIPIFQFALNVPGFLVLGSAETVGDNADLFDLVDRGNKIYSKKASASRPLAHFTPENLTRDMSFGIRRPGASGPTSADFLKEADRILLGRFAPPAVLVNDNFEVLQFRGQLGAFLEPPPGEPTNDVLKMAREGLFLELRNALTEARSSLALVRRSNVRVRANGGFQEIELEVAPVKPPGGGDPCFLVLFHRTPSGVRLPGVTETSVAQAQSVHETAPDTESSDRLRQELTATKTYLQSLVEQQDASNEELRSANEEILSSNEELQSTNEELETAKEELQSVNEELTTVNEQLQHRNEELNRSNNDLNNLLASTSIPVVMVGNDLRIRRFNPPAQKALRLLTSDVGRPIGDLKVAMLLPELEDLIHSVIGEVKPFECEVQDADKVWQLLRIQPYRTNESKIDGAVLCLVEIDRIKRAEAELRESQEQLSTALAAGNMGTWSVDLSTDLRRHDANEARLLGLDPKQVELSLEDYLGCIHPADLPLVKSAFASAISGNSEVFEYRVVLPNQVTRWLSSTGTVRTDSNSRATQLVGVTYDITSHKEAEESLRKADRRKDEFLMLLAHELRHPLAPIRNAVGILHLAKDDPKTVATARAILDRQVLQLSRIIEDLIDVSRIIEHRVKLEPKRLRVDAAIQTAIETCTSTMEANHLQFTVSLPQQPVFLDVDPARLTQVLVNVLNNASKFTEAGGKVWMKIETARLQDPNGDTSPSGPTHVLVRVIDTGVGIPAESLPHVFDGFTRADPALDHSSGGLGIGLSLARNLIHMHGGTIEAHSAGRGRGSEFTITLPLASEPATDRVPADGLSSRGEHRRRRVLIVDDHADQGDSLGRLFEIMQHDVAVARDGQHALELAQSFEPDLALIDIGLPGMDGHEIARRLRHMPRFKNLVMVAQTGWGGPQDRRRSELSGFDLHLVKPLGLEQLKQALSVEHRAKA